MHSNLRNLPVNERIQLVEDLWGSIALDQESLPLTKDQEMELDKRLQAFESDSKPGRLADDGIIIKDIRSRL